MKRSIFVSLLCIGVLASGAPSPAFARSIELTDFGPAAIHVNFDDLPGGTIVGDAYLRYGISIENGIATSRSSAVSSPNLLVNVGNGPVTVRFQYGVAEVGIQIDSDGFSGRTPQMRAFNGTGQQLEVGFFGQGPDFVGIEAPAGDLIYSIQLGSTIANVNDPLQFSDGYDNLIFEYAPGNPSYPEFSSPNRQQDGWFGYSLGSVPDVDGDGKTDIIVGAPRESVGATTTTGRVYVFSSAGGRTLYTLTSPNPEANGNFGVSVAGADVNNDGIGDFIVGASREDVGGQVDQGRCYVFSGQDGSLLWTITLGTAQAQVGVSVSGIHDVNGDGKDDILLGVPYETVGPLLQRGTCYIYSGATGTLLRAIAPPNPAFLGRFGRACVGVGDVDGNGSGEVLVTDGDTVQLISGSTGSVIRSLTPPGSPGWATVFNGALAAVPDVDDDTRPDLLVGALYDFSTTSVTLQTGRAHLYSGATGTLLHTFQAPQEVQYGWFGMSVAGLPDIDGDGHGDVAIGTPFEDRWGRQQVGAVYVFSGSNGALIAQIHSPHQEDGGHFGQSIAGLADIDGDGHGDVTAGAPFENPLDRPINSGQMYLLASASNLLIDNAAIQSNTVSTSQFPGDPFLATVTVKNTGDSVWSDARGYRLAVIEDNNAIVVGPPAGLNMLAGVQALPGQSYLFKIPLKMPLTPGDYTVRLRMVHGAAGYFGETLNATVHVFSSAESLNWASYK